MCGIIGYTGEKDAVGVLIKGLKTLEYRGYDSAGISVNDSVNEEIIKCTGRVEKLEKLTKNIKFASTGIGHTRWATHGEVTEENSHPHKFGRVTLVHNGIIENYNELIEKYNLFDKLKSQTDSEAAAAVFNEYYNGDALSAIKNAVAEFKGTYAFAIIFENEKDTIYAIRNVSPIVICKNSEGSFIASDILAIGEYCNSYFLLDEMTTAKITKDNITLTDLSGKEVSPNEIKSDLSAVKSDKCGYPFFMEKEIFEQPQAIKNTIAGRIVNGIADFSLDNINDSIFEKINNISIIACGTAMHAGLIGKFLIEKYAKIPCSVYLASEFTYSTPIINDKTLVICISQSGETIDTLEALKYAKSKGAKSLSIINVENSSIARESDSVIYTKAGPEIAVASTKAYTTQVAVLYLITAKLCRIYKTVTESEIKDFTSKINNVVQDIENILERKEEIHSLSKLLISCEHTFMIGRGLDYPTLLEASLKLKEISYIHSEAFASGELKHGTIALITKDTPVIALVSQEKLKSKEISNIKEVLSRGAKVISLIKKSLNDNEIECSFELPDTDDDFSVFPAVCTLQLLAYYVSSDKGLDVDKPRNLAKVVTVE